jgi:hypothetical protein
LREDLAGFQIYKMHKLTCEARHLNVTVTISRFIFGGVALNTKAGVGAPVENRNHARANAAQQQ